MQKADTIQYIHLCKSLNVLLSHQDALSEVLKSQEVTEHDNILRTYHDGSAFKSNSLLNSENKILEMVLYHDDFGIVNCKKHQVFILCLEISLLTIDLAKRTSI